MWRAASVTRQEYEEKIERGIAQVQAGQGITKTMEELERMEKDEMRVAQIQLPDPADTDPHPRLLLEASMPGSGSLRCSRMAGMMLRWRFAGSRLALVAGTSLHLDLRTFARWGCL